MNQTQDPPKPPELSPQLVTIMTTEHYNLQTGRSIVTSETNGRSSLYVGAVSSGLIALVFVGQLSHLGEAFFVFSLVVMPTLLFMGLITFERVLQAGIEDLIYARGINRIRHLYIESAPQMEPYFIHWLHGDPYFILHARGKGSGAIEQKELTPWSQIFHNTATMVAVITSVLAGSFVGLLATALDLPVWARIFAGIVGFLAMLVYLQRVQRRQFRRLAGTMPALFPEGNPSS